MSDDVKKTDEEWRATLTPEQYRVMRQKGTERAFTGKYWNHQEPGVYRCAGCGTELFESETKFDAHCGWPSFYQPASTEAVATEEDRSHVMVRTEVHCAKCAAHFAQWTSVRTMKWLRSSSVSTASADAG